MNEYQKKYWKEKRQEDARRFHSGGRAVSIGLARWIIFGREKPLNDCGIFIRL